MTAKEIFWRIVGALASTVLALFLVMKVMGVDNGMVGLIITFLLFVLFFLHKLGAAGPWLRLAFGVTGAVMLLINWSFTGPTTSWFINQTERVAPRENFDPKSAPDPSNPTADAAVKFVRLEDGTLDDVPLTWKRDPRTGLPLAEPGTPEYWNLLNEYNSQESRNSAESGTGGLPTKTIPVSLDAGERWSVEPRNLVSGDADYVWSLPTGRVMVQLYDRGDKLAGSCESGPGVKAYCDLPYVDYGKLVFTASEPAQFKFTATRKEA